MDASQRAAECAQGFFYNRYMPVGNATGQATGANKNQQLWYHTVGTPQSADTFVLALPDQPEWSLGAGVTDDEMCACNRPPVFALFKEYCLFPGRLFVSY